ncbi:hypothetical protein RHSIM_Rhsim05G0139000 [Rhododendron simsii]|uniref:ATP-dependent Clp protease proteolytic subunit n=1 Tax=Rhododendron simsii TaxID=118357 RepID=A0A834LM61_RHOSS|nr:hypothetical protein RHSIM_Rhsim05G0139000 [Rhododendron simsii]
MATLLPSPITSSSSSSSIPPPFSFSSSQSLRRRSTHTLCCTNSRSAARFLVPPVNPSFSNIKGSFLPSLAPAARTSRWVTRVYVDWVSGPAFVNTQEAPDDRSFFLRDRIVHICLPFETDVTELVLAQLMYLESKNADKPISFYIDSTGSEDEYGETVGMETEGFAIYDAVMQLRCEVRTMCLGEAAGPACLLLAAGTKGKRYMFPNASAILEEPIVPPLGLMEPSYANLITKEVLTQKRIFAELMAKHTGQSVETIEEDMGYGLRLYGEEAIQYGIADHILPRGKKKIRPQKKVTKEPDQSLEPKVSEENPGADNGELLIATLRYVDFDSRETLSFSHK